MKSIVHLGAACAVIGLLSACGGGNSSGNSSSSSATPSGGTNTAPGPQTVVLTVGGSGDVASNPAGINCSNATTACSQAFAAGTSVALTATPATGNVFVGWTGACSGTAACVLSVNATENVGATFAPIVQTDSLFVTLGGKGTVTSSPAGINCSGGASGCGATYSAGTVVTLSSSPAAGYVFTGWTGACSGSSTTCSVTLNSASQSVGATFTASAAKYLTSDAYPLGSQQPNHFDVSCDGLAVVTSAPAVNADGTSYLRYNVSGLAAGAHTCSVTAADATNNQSVAASISFTL